MPENKSGKDLFNQSVSGSEAINDILNFDYEGNVGKILKKFGNIDASQLLQSLCLRNDNAGEVLAEIDKISERQLNKALSIQNKIIDQIVDYKTDIDVEKISDDTDELESDEECELEGMIAGHQDKDSLDFQKLLNLVVFFLRDKHIGNIKKLISNVEKDQYDLKALARIGEFTGLIAHVVRNPLANILITADLLKSKFDEDDARLPYVKTIIGEIEKLETKIEDMVNYKDIKDTREAPLEVVDVHDIISIVIADLQKKFDDKQIAVSTSFSTKIQKIPLLATKIEETILNILQNMIDALTTGGEVNIITDVENTTVNGKSSIIIIIEDNGEGVAPENIDHIFDPCFTTKKTGMGLGLYMSKKFIADHGGNLSVENKSDGGAKFTIVLPVKSIEDV